MASDDVTDILRQLVDGAIAIATGKPPEHHENGEESVINQNHSALSSQQESECERDDNVEMTDISKEGNEGHSELITKDDDMSKTSGNAESVSEDGEMTHIPQDGGEGDSESIRKDDNSAPKTSGNAECVSQETSEILKNSEITPTDGNSSKIIENIVREVSGASLNPDAETDPKANLIMTSSTTGTDSNIQALLTSPRDMATQTTCSCQCFCAYGLGSLFPVVKIEPIDYSSIPSAQVPALTPAPTPNKRKRGRPRKHPLPDPAVMQKATEKAKPGRRRKAKNVSYFEPDEGSDLDVAQNEVVTVNSNKKMKVPTLKIKLKGPNTKKEANTKKEKAPQNPKEKKANKKSHREFKNEVLKHLKFVEVGKTWNVVDDVNGDVNSQQEQLLNGNNTEASHGDNIDKNKSLNSNEDNQERVIVKQEAPERPDSAQGHEGRDNASLLNYDDTVGCIECGKRFMSPSDLREHRRRQHGIEVIDEYSGGDIGNEDMSDEGNDYEDSFMSGVEEIDDDDDDDNEDDNRDSDWKEESDPEYDPDEGIKNKTTPRITTRNSAKKGRSPKGGKGSAEKFGSQGSESEAGVDLAANLDLAKLLGNGVDLMEVPQEVTMKGERLLTCVICNKVFKGESHFLRHLGTHTGHRPFICGVCGEGFRIRKHLIRHEKSHSTDKNFSCDFCPKKLKTASGLKYHLRMHESPGERPWTCDECGKHFTQKVGLEVHKSTIHEGIKRYKCDSCDMAFGRLNHLVRHMYKHRIEAEGLELPFECVTCSRRFLREDGLKNHERIHTGERPYVCLLCDMAFKSSSDLSGHSRVHTNVRNHVCEVCGAAFKMKRGLTRHMAAHSSDRPHICEFCGLSFKHDQTLKIHLRTHSNFKPYKCDQCDYRSSQLSNLKYHQAKHSDERNCTCEICGKQFKHNRHMKRHMISHDENKKYGCEICGKKFSRFGSRKKHMLVHTGQKPFPCKVCDKTFRQSSTLRVHMMIHENKKPYACDVCHVTFRRYAHLERHQRTHTGEKPYGCPICGKRFTRPVCLPNHMKRHERQGEYVPPGGSSGMEVEEEIGSDMTHMRLQMGSENQNGEVVNEHVQDIRMVNDPHHDVDSPPNNFAAHQQGTPINPFLFTLPYFATQSAWPCE